MNEFQDHELALDDRLLRKIQVAMLVTSPTQGDGRLCFSRRRDVDMQAFTG